jgi:hypothetical protein
MCGTVYKKGVSDEEAAQECIDIFGIDVFEKSELDVVCDDCFNKINPKNNQELVNELIEKYSNK